MRGILRDLRHGIRVLRRAPVLSLTAVITIGIGAGANATVASFIDALLFRAPPGVIDSSRVVSIYSSDYSGGPYGSTSIPDYLSMVAETDAFSGIAASDDDPGVIVTVGSNVERVSRSSVTTNFFDVLGLRPVIGRFFVSSDGAAGAQPVAVIGHAFWRRLFNGHSSALGATLSFNGITYTVVGVAPERFDGLDLARAREIWTTIDTAGTDSAARGDRGLAVIARLRPDADRAQSQLQLRALADRLGRDFPATNLGTLEHPDRARPFTVTPYTRIGAQFRAQVTTISGLLIAASLLVLVIAAANVGNLLLARSTTRQRELSIRIAVGARRGEIVRQLLFESLTLGVAGAMVGVVLALWTAGVLPSFFPAEQVRLLQASVDIRVLMFCLAASVVASVVFALPPALQALRPATSDVLRREATSASEGRSSGRTRRAFVVVQVALAFVLMVGAGLLTQSLQNSFAADPGFGTRQGAVVSIDLPPDFSPEQGLHYYRKALDRIQSLPGVERAALSHVAPLSRGPRRFFAVPEYSPRAGEDMEFFFNIVSSSYFQALRIPLEAGRYFDDRDQSTATPVVIVNDELARRYLPGGALGRPIRSSSDIELTIVGVVRAGLPADPRSPPQPVVYFPLEQAFNRSVRVIASTTGDPAKVMSSLLATLKTADARVAVFRPTTIAAHFDEALAADRLLTSLVSTCGLFALALAAVGVYGMVAYSVASRIREIGIRVALGASARRVSRMVINEALLLLGRGVLIGGALAAAVTTLAQAMLYEVSALDPVTYLAVPALLVGVGVAAAVVPIRRALKIDPALILRQV
jgi:putative ABC transport system permease protein